MICPYESLRRGLIGAWCPSLGATGYTLLDRSPRNNHGTLGSMGGQVNWPATPGGAAIAFDGSNDSVSIPASAPLATATWASFWFRLTSTLAANNSYTLLALSPESVSPFRTNLYLGVNIINDALAPNYRNGRLEVLTFDANGSPATSGAYSTTDFRSLTNMWYHCSAGWDGSAWKMFVNGVDQTTAYGTQRAATTPPLSPSVVGGSSGRFTPVQMDDIRVWSRPLTLAEIERLASQRGIGLLNSRHRRSPAIASLGLKVGGVWKQATPWIKVSGTWRQAVPYTKIAGAWK